MSNKENENISLQVEEPEAEQQGVRSANWLNFDLFLHPGGPTSKKNDVAGIEWLGLNHLLLQREAILLVQRELYVYYVQVLGKVLVLL